MEQMILLQTLIIRKYWLPVLLHFLKRSTHVPVSEEIEYKSVIYFGVIFSVVMLLNTIAIGKYKLIDLLYGGRKNEMIRIKNMKTAIKVFVASVLCLAAAYALILNNGIIHVNLYFTLSIIFGMVGTLLFFWSLSSILVQIMQRNKRLYFKQLNMFIVRQFSCKINTNFVSLSVVCIVLMLVIGIFSTWFRYAEHFINSATYGNTV